MLITRRRVVGWRRQLIRRPRAGAPAGTSLRLAGAPEASGPRYYHTAGNVSALRNKAAWSVAFSARLDTLTNATDAGNALQFFVLRGGVNDIGINLYDDAGTPKVSVDGYHFEAADNGVFEAFGTTAQSLAFDTPVHVAVVFNDGGDKAVKVYLDGALATTSSAHTLADPRTRDLDRPIRIGFHNANAVSIGGEADFDNVGVWDVALSSAQVASLAGGADPATVGSPLVAWTCDGTLDAAAVLGDPGLPNSLIDTTAGSGTATYKASLI